MASFNDCLHLASRARSSDDAPKSFRVSPLARFRATTRTILSPLPPSLLPASWACELLDADRSANTEVNFVTEISDSTSNVRRPYKLRPRLLPRYMPVRVKSAILLLGGHNLKYVSSYAINHPPGGIRYDVHVRVRVYTDKQLKPLPN